MKKFPAPALPRLSRIALALAVLPASVLANQSLSSAGYGLTTGPVFNRANLGSAAYNPANAIRLVAPEEQFRLGYVEVSGRYELGDLNDVANMRDSIKSDIDMAMGTPTLNMASTLANKVTDVYLPALNNGARFVGQARASLLTPVLMRTEDRLPGVWSFNVNAQAQMSGAFRGSAVNLLVKLKSGGTATNVELPVNSLLDQLAAVETAAGSGTLQDQATAMNNLITGATNILNSSDLTALRGIATNVLNGGGLTAQFSARTASAFDFKVAEVNQISLGYAYDMTAQTPAGMRELMPNGKLDVGLRVNAYQANLYRQVLALMDESGNANQVDFSSNANFHSSTAALGLDLGVLWSDDHYQFGVTVYNLNSPRFVYPNPVNDTNAANSWAAQQLNSKGLLTLKDAVVLKPHAVLEASVFSADKRWLLQGSFAANETTDFVGDPQRIATVSASFNADRLEGWARLLPSVRVGLRQNTVGTKLSTVGLGMSWGALSLDANVSTQKVVASGQSVPRAAGFAITFAEPF